MDRRSARFHAFAFGVVMMSLTLGSTVVLRRRFRADQALRDIEDHRVDAAFMVPALLQRLLEEQRTAPLDTSSLKAIVVTGSKLGASLAVDAMNEFGDDVRNYVRENLARFKVPRDVLFLDELPRTPTGKVLKRELAKLEVPEPQ